MSPRQRLAFALIAVVIAVVAVVAIAAGGGSDDGGDRASSTDAVTTPEATPEPEEQQEASAAEEPEPTPTPTSDPVPKVVVKGGEPVGGVEELEVTEGQRVRFTVVSDVADEVHVHGYDLMKDVSAGGQATFSFKATITGIFEAELEDRGVQVASIRVDPR